jgi:hypothetical protein
MQKYPPDMLRPIEAQGNGLRPGTGGAPPTLIALWARAKRIFYREGWVF